jgi:hypothetical protein
MDGRNVQSRAQHAGGSAARRRMGRRKPVHSDVAGSRVPAGPQSGAGRTRNRKRAEAADSHKLPAAAGTRNDPPRIRRDSIQVEAVAAALAVRRRRRLNLLLRCL